MSAKILSNYVKRNAFFAITFSVLGIWLLQLVFAYLGELEDLSEAYTNVDIFYYILYRSPYYLQLFIPTGALLGAVLGLGILANQSELVVMRAAGVSIFRIVVWVLQPALLFVALALLANQFVLPVTNPLARQIGEEDKFKIVNIQGYWQVQDLPVGGGLSDGQQAQNLDSESNLGKRVIYIDYADSLGNIGTVKRWQFDDRGDLLWADTAQGGHFLPDRSSDEAGYAWRLDQVRVLRLPSDLTGKMAASQTFYQDQAVLHLPIAPDFLYLLVKNVNDLSISELWLYRTLMQDRGEVAAEHDLMFWQRLLSPFSVLSLVVVACSFVFGSLRSHSLGLRVVIALLFGLLFHYLQDLFGYVALALGWSPFLMVGLPIVLVSLLGIWLIKKQG